MASETVNRLYQDYMEAAKRDPFNGGEKSWVIVARLGDVILSYVPGCIVEVGIGFSTIVLARMAAAFGRRFHTCDIKEGRVEWAKQIAGDIAGDDAIVSRCRSFEMMNNFDEPVALGLIDGDHSAKTVVREVAFFFSKLNPGGVLFLHDTCPVPFRWEKKREEGGKMDTHTVRKALEERSDMDVFTWRYTAAGCGLTMILKKDPSDPEYRR